MNRTPLLIPLLSFCAGILSTQIEFVGFMAGIVWILLALSIYLWILRMSKDPITAYRLRNLHFLWLALCFLGVGTVIATIDKPETLSESMLNHPVFVSGTVEDVKQGTTGDRIIVNVGSVSNSGDNAHQYSNLKLTAVSAYRSVAVGDCVSFKAELREIRDTENSFSTGYASLMRNKGIFYSAFMTGDALKITDNQSSLRKISCDARDCLERYIEYSPLDLGTKRFLIVILLGDRSFLDSDLKETFAYAGVAHILALSGMHIAIITAIFLFILFPLNFAGKFKTRIIIAAVMMWGYVFISGMSPSTVRASIMFSFMAVALCLERKHQSFNALCGAVLAILVCSPLAIYDVGLQLSCVCVATIIFFAKPLNPFDYHDHPAAYRFAGAVITTIAVTFGSWILTAYYFHIFPLMFLPANLIVLPLLPIYLVVSLLYLTIYSFIGIDLSTLRFISDHGYRMLEDFTARISDDSAIAVYPEAGSVLLWFGALFFLLIYLNYRRRRVWLAGGICLGALSLATIFLLPGDNVINEHSFIIRKEYHDCSLNVMDGNSERILTFPYQGVSSITHANRKFISANGNIHRGIDTTDGIIIIRSGFKESVKELLEHGRPSLVVIHPSVRRNREQQLLQEAARNGLETHSLRLQGAYRSKR